MNGTMHQGNGTEVMEMNCGSSMRTVLCANGLQASMTLQFTIPKENFDNRSGEEAFTITWLTCHYFFNWLGFSKCRPFIDKSCKHFSKGSKFSIVGRAPEKLNELLCHSFMVNGD